MLAFYSIFSFSWDFSCFLSVDAMLQKTVPRKSCFDAYKAAELLKGHGTSVEAYENFNFPFRRTRSGFAVLFVLKRACCIRYFRFLFLDNLQMRVFGCDNYPTNKGIA